MNAPDLSANSAVKIIFIRRRKKYSRSGFSTKFFYICIALAKRKDLKTAESSATSLKSENKNNARMAELVDALVSGTSVRKDVQVRVLFRALK